jgi:hypothetical protein
LDLQQHEARILSVQQQHDASMQTMKVQHAQVPQHAQSAFLALDNTSELLLIVLILIL